MDRHDARTYPGHYVSCVYNPDRALRRDAGDANGNVTPRRFPQGRSLEN